MKLSYSVLVLCLAAFAAPRMHAATEDKPLPATLNLAVPADDTTSSSSSTLPDAPALEAHMASGGGDQVLKTTTRPFSGVAVAVKVGVEGIGFDVATPLVNRLNLRAGASFFSYSPSLTEDGIGVNGTLTLRTVRASLDFFPFGNAFRISPGLVINNGNHLAANATVAGGQSFTLGDNTYYSSTTNPVTGTFDMAFGNKVAPSFTVGTGNMLKRNGRISVPFEVGFEYIGAPTIALNLIGNACLTTPCTVGTPINTLAGSNVQQEQTNLNNDISALKVYPILSIGISYKLWSAH